MYEYVLSKWNKLEHVFHVSHLDLEQKAIIDAQYASNQLMARETAEKKLQEAEKKLEEAKVWLKAFQQDGVVTRAAMTPPTAEWFERYIAGAAAGRRFDPRDRLSVKTSVKVRFTEFQTDCVNATKKLAKGKGTTTDKSHLPLPCIIAAAGQGKTEGLLWLYQNADGIHRKIMKKWNAQPWLDDATEARPHVRHIVPLFATFNQDTTFSPTGDTEAHSALIRRMICTWKGIRYDSLQPLPSNVFTSHFLEYVREVEAAKNKCRVDEIGILLLIDEIRKLDNMRGAVLDAINDVMHGDITRGLCTIPVVSCLDVSTLFAVVTEGTKRPLIGIRMYPCPSDDLPPKIVDSAKATLNRMNPPRPEEALLALKFALAQCAGHYRSLEAIVEHPTELKSDIQLRHEYADAALHLLANLIRSPAQWYDETAAFGTVETGHQWQLSKMAFSGCAATTYADFKPTGQVRPSIIPFALLTWAKTPSMIPRHLEVIAGLLADVVAGLLRVDNKTWERTVPMLECAVALLFGRYISKVSHVSWLDLYGVSDATSTDRLLIRGAPPTITSARLQQLTEWSDCSVWTPAGTDGVIDAQRSELRSHLKQESDVRLVSGFPANPTYPGVEGCHRLFGQYVFVQSKKYKTTEVTKDAVVEWAEKAHAEAEHVVTGEKQISGAAKTPTWFVVMYVSKARPEGLTAADLPVNTAVVFRAGLQHLLGPFGMSPLLQEIDAAAGLPPA